MNILKYFINAINTNTGIIAILTITTSSIVTIANTYLTKKFELKRYKQQLITDKKTAIYGELYEKLIELIELLREYHNNEHEDKNTKFFLHKSNLINLKIKYSIFLSQKFLKILDECIKNLSESMDLSNAREYESKQTELNICLYTKKILRERIIEQFYELNNITFKHDNDILQLIKKELEVQN
ncbi:MAG: hypothetical protein WCK67_05570 [bacterium]